MPVSGGRLAAGNGPPARGGELARGGDDGGDDCVASAAGTVTEAIGVAVLLTTGVAVPEVAVGVRVFVAVPVAGVSVAIAVGVSVGAAAAWTTIVPLIPPPAGVPCTRQ